MFKLGWSVKPCFELPPKFELREDEDFAYLYCDDELVATFGARAVPEEILKVCHSYEKARLVG